MQEADWSVHMLTGCKRIRREFFWRWVCKISGFDGASQWVQSVCFYAKMFLAAVFPLPRQTHTQHHSHESCHEQRLQTSPRYHWICLQIVSICQSLLCLLLASLWLNSAMQKQTLSGPAKKLGVLFLARSLIETAAWELCGVSPRKASSWEQYVRAAHYRERVPAQNRRLQGWVRRARCQNMHIYRGCYVDGHSAVKPARLCVREHTATDVCVSLCSTRSCLIKFRTDYANCFFVMPHI